MATPTYFSNFPNIDYAIRMNKAGVIDRIKIKDYFHLLKVRDDISPNKTLYTPYYIKNGERPDQISYDFYGDEQYYWIILQINEITDYFSEWPLSQYELDEYIIKKYGSISASQEVRHYETVEIYDKDRNLILPGRGTPGPDRGGLAKKGLVVPPDYSITYPDRPDSEVYITRSGFTGTTAACTPITYQQYEYDLNEDKSQIFILQKKYIKDYIREVNRYSKDLPDLMSDSDVSDFDA